MPAGCIRNGLLLAALSLGLLSGCGGGPQGPETVQVEGTVTYDGEPLPEGDIIFRPAQGSGRSYAGQIQDGRFSFQTEPGQKKVEVTATKELEIDPSEAAPEEQIQLEEKGGTVPKQYIPAQYNEETTLTAEVKADGPNKFEFNLQSNQ